MSGSININSLANEVMKGLSEYSDLATEEMKKAVRKAGNAVKNEIKATAPKDTGGYVKSWTVKKIRESSHTLNLTVHSRNKYQLTHLLEYGHAARTGGRTKAQPHIAPAEEKGIEVLEEEIMKALR